MATSKGPQYPSRETLAKMSKKLEKTKGSYVLPADANVLDQAKYEVCKRILIYMHRKGFTQRQLAKKMGIAETRVSEVVHYRIEKFTLDKLVSYYEKINPKVTVSVN